MPYSTALDVLWARNLLRPADFGGSRYHWEVTRRLASRYRSFRVVSARPGGPLPGTFAGELRPYSVSRRTPLHTFLTHVVASRRAVAAEVRRRRPDVIVLSSYDVAFGHFALQHSSSVPTLFIYHSSFFSESVARSRRVPLVGSAVHAALHAFTRAVERVTLRGASAVVAVSPFSAREVLAHRGITAVRIVPTGVDTGQFAPGDRKAARHRLGLDGEGRTLLCVGRLAGVKRFDRAIAALGILRAHDDRYRLIVAGSGSEASVLRAQADPLGAAVRFSGHVDGDLLIDHYRAADLTLCTSDFENWSVAILESLACATPVLGTPYGGTPELLGDVDRVLVLPNGDPREIAARVHTLFAEPGTLAALGARGRETVEKSYSWDRTADGVAEAIQAIASPQ